MLDFVIKYRRVSIPEFGIVIQYHASNYRDLPMHRRNRHNSISSGVIVTSSGWGINHLQ